RLVGRIARGRRVHRRCALRRRPGLRDSCRSRYPMTRSGSRGDSVWGARVAPVVAAVEPRMAPATAERAARFARELGAPVAFVSVRTRLPTDTRRDGEEPRLSRALLLGRKALDIALAAAARHG